MLIWNRAGFKKFWGIFRWIIGFGLVGLILLVLYQNRQDFLLALSEANWFWLALAFGLNLLASLVYIGLWKICAAKLGATGGFRGSLLAVSLASAARYIPGGIWPVASLVYFGPKVGLPRKFMPLLAALAQLTHLLVAGLVAVAGFGFFANFKGLANWELLFACFLGLVLASGAVALLPRYLFGLLKFKEKFERPLTLWKPALASALFWLLNGFRLWLMALAFGPTGLPLVPYMVWAGATTTLITTFFFFIPLGLGVVELSLGWWLGLVLPWPQALAILALNRFIRTANDLFFLGLSRLVG